MSMPSKWEMVPGDTTATPSQIAKLTCGSPDKVSGQKLADNAACCKTAFGCWCIGLITYCKATNYTYPGSAGDPAPIDFDCGEGSGSRRNPCRYYPVLAAYHLGGYAGNICPSPGVNGCPMTGVEANPDWLPGFTAGDTLSGTSIFSGGDGSGCGTHALTIVLHDTKGWVLYYDDSNSRAYLNIKFQNPPVDVGAGELRACCNTSTPCYEAMDVPHIKTSQTANNGLTCLDGTPCLVDDWNAGVTCVSCVGHNLGHPGALALHCTDWGGTDPFTGDPIPEIGITCPNITEGSFVPTTSNTFHACP